MKFAEAKVLLLQLSQSTPDAEVERRGDELLVKQVLGRSGSVRRLLRLRLTFERKRGHVHLSSGLAYHCPQWHTHPVGEVYLRSIEGVPPDVVARLVRLRQSLDGHVGYEPDEELVHGGASTQVQLDDWSENQLIEHLLHVFTAAAYAAELPIPASNARELKAWHEQRTRLLWPSAWDR